MSLDSQGDYTRDRSSNNAANSSDRATSERGKRAESNLQNILTGNVSTGQTSAVSDRTRRGALGLDCQLTGTVTVFCLPK